MIELAIFSKETPAALSPETFYALSDADKSLAVRLMREAGLPVGQFEKATGLPLPQLRAMAKQSHSVHLAGETSTPQPRVKSKEGDISEPSAKILRVFSDSDEPLTISYAEIEKRADLKNGAAHPCLRGLATRGLLACLRAGRGARTATWTITDEGRALAATLFTEVA